MGSLAYSERYTLEQLQAAIAPGNDPGFLFMPVGRSAWHEQTRVRILERIQDVDQNQTLLEAGFCKGQQDFLEAAISDFLRISGRMGW